jgi:hypothetical protein
LNALADVQRFDLPRRIAIQTQTALRAYGIREQEGRVIWFGKYRSPDVFEFTRSAVPQQETSWAETIVDHDEILLQAQEAVSRGEELGAQVHTHPGAAFHSAVDNQFPIIREVGGLSIVIPDYAEAPLDSLGHCAVFRLSHQGWCGPLPTETLNELIRFKGRE